MTAADLETRFYRDSLRYLKNIDISLGRIANALADMNEREDVRLSEKRNITCTEKCTHDVSNLAILSSYANDRQNNCKAGM